VPQELLTARNLRCASILWLGGGAAARRALSAGYLDAWPRLAPLEDGMEVGLGQRWGTCLEPQANDFDLMIHLIYHHDDDDDDGGDDDDDDASIII